MSTANEPAPAMRPRDWFAVGLRLLGVWVCIRGIEYAVSLAAMRLGLGVGQAAFNQQAEGLHYLFYASADIALGIGLILGAEQFTNLAFRVYRRSPENRDEDEPREDGVNTLDA